jgi:hypothetical protein
MRMMDRFAILAASLLISAGFAAAATPNLTGDWKLNISKSEMGEMPPPSSMTQKVTHQDPKLKVAVKQSSDMGDFEFEASYTTDGKESVNTIRDNESKSVVKWDGDALLFDTNGKFGDNDFNMKDKWTLSADGKVLTIERHFSSSMGEGDQKLVFEKQ